MRFEVTHLTRYIYASSVFLEPQTLRLKPLTNANQRLLSYELDINPRPALITELVDAAGNDSTVFWPDGRVDHLSIETHSSVETLRANPFDFLLHGSNSLPMSYKPDIEPALARYRAGGNPAARKLALEVVASIEENAQAFPYHLAAVLHDRIPTIVRPEGEPMAPEETLRAGEGSCRDIAVLYIAVCRELGYAARFVSGYHGTEDDEHDLHAWPEIYLPGGGWRGFDPTTGLAVADQHVALAAGASPQESAPVSGFYRGRSAAKLETRVTILRTG